MGARWTYLAYSYYPDSFIDESGYKIRLEEDGGVGVQNIREIAEAGADMFVAGSAIFNSEDYAETIKAMRNELGQAPDPHH